MNTRIIGLDIGGTKTRVVLFDGKNIQEHKEIKTPDTEKTFFNKLFALVSSMDSHPEKIGVAFAGLIDKKGVILRSPNLPFIEEINIVNQFQNKFKAKILTDNDVKCFIRAEKRFGIVRNYSNIVAITIGTGVGGAIMIDDKIIFGTHHSAGEIGRLVLPGTFKKNNGANTPQWDELENFVSRKWFLKFGIKEVATAAIEARKGNQVTQQVFSEFGINLALLASTLVNIIDPEVIVIGGGIAKAKDLFMDSFETHFKKFIFSPHTREEIKVVFSDNSNSAALGAALLFENSYGI